MPARGCLTTFHHPNTCSAHESAGQNPGAHLAVTHTPPLFSTEEENGVQKRPPLEALQFDHPNTCPAHVSAAQNPSAFLAVTHTPPLFSTEKENGMRLKGAATLRSS
jgi:hypothetical protein